MIVLEWLFLTLGPVELVPSEPWQLGSQDAATPMMQGTYITISSLSVFLCFFVSYFMLWKWRFYYFYFPNFDGTTSKLLLTLFTRIILFLVLSPDIAHCAGEASDANHPPIENAVSPGREPELDLRLGQPGVQVEDPEGLSPAERRLRERLNWNGHPNVSLDYIQAMLHLKEEIVMRIAQLDPHPFWTEHKARIIDNYIITPKGEEYSLSTMEKIGRGLEAENAPNHYFLKRMIGVRKDFLWTGRFY